MTSWKCKQNHVIALQSRAPCYLGSPRSLASTQVLVMAPAGPFGHFLPCPHIPYVPVKPNHYRFHPLSLTSHTVTPKRLCRKAVTIAWKAPPSSLGHRALVLQASLGVPSSRKLPPPTLGWFPSCSHSPWCRPGLSADGTALHSLRLLLSGKGAPDGEAE